MWEEKTNKFLYLSKYSTQTNQTNRVFIQTALIFTFINNRKQSIMTLTASDSVYHSLNINTEIN